MRYGTHSSVSWLCLDSLLGNPWTLMLCYFRFQFKGVDILLWTTVQSKTGFWKRTWGILGSDPTSPVILFYPLESEQVFPEQATRLRGIGNVALGLDASSFHWAQVINHKPAQTRRILNMYVLHAVPKTTSSTLTLCGLPFSQLPRRTVSKLNILWNNTVGGIMGAIQTRESRSVEMTGLGKCSLGLLD